jgi:hypothetical protein
MLLQPQIKQSRHAIVFVFTAWNDVCALSTRVVGVRGHDGMASHTTNAALHGDCIWGTLQNEMRQIIAFNFSHSIHNDMHVMTQTPCMEDMNMLGMGGVADASWLQQETRMTQVSHARSRNRFRVSGRPCCPT